MSHALVKPKIVSVTLTGNAEHLIHDALSSVVPWVDLCLVVDTGVTDGTLDRAKAIAKERMHVVQFPWCHDFSAARNFSLQVAAEIGGQWALILDTDMRYVVRDPERLQLSIESDSASCYLIPFADGSYTKELLVRLPPAFRWVGLTHEALIPLGPVERRVTQALVFNEVPKSVQEYEAKFKRDIVLLKEQIQHDPQNPRWHFYLGESFRNLKDWVQARAAYGACAHLKGWDEESAWACFQGARCASFLNEHNNALELCAQGLMRHGGMGELAWLGAYSCYVMGRYRDALGWGEMAAALGCYRGLGAHFERIAFKDLHALFEGPEDVIYHAFLALGLTKQAQLAQIRCQEAKIKREAYLKTLLGVSSQ